jgi:hypothetical protein
MSFLNNNQKKIKRSIDFDEETLELLDRYKLDNDLASTGAAIRKIVKTIFNAPERVKQHIAYSCNSAVADMGKSLSPEETSAYNSRQFADECQSYFDIAQLFSYGIQAKSYEEVEEKRMKKIDLNNGFLLVPEKWIILNSENQMDEDAVPCVLETRNNEKWAKVVGVDEIPHFVYFVVPSGILNGKKLDIFREEAIQRAKIEWPKYREVYKHYVPLQYEEGVGYVNAAESNASPFPGFFIIPEYDDPARSYPRDYPYHAAVFHNVV